MRVLVCGGRDFPDKQAVFAALDELHASKSGPIKKIIHGCASGADSFSFEWACARRVSAVGFPADWRGRGRRAGPERNQCMLDEGKPDLVVAFPGGRGTADMVKRANAYGVMVLKRRSPPK